MIGLVSGVEFSRSRTMLVTQCELEPVTVKLENPQRDVLPIRGNEVNVHGLVIGIDLKQNFTGFAVFTGEFNPNAVKSE